MRRRIPSTAALVAFEASARHESFTRAADELALTQSAVCRQIASLEAALDTKLFRRTRRGVKLTQAGTEYGQKVAARLDGLESDTLDLMAGVGSRSVVELAVVPTFATRWLLPRLGGFSQLQPRVQVNMHVRTRPFLFDDTPFDAAVYAGDGHWPGCETRRVMPERLAPVCSPALLAARAVRTVTDLGKLPLLQQTTRPYAWRRWFAAAGTQVPGDLQGARYELFSMSVQAALLGMGVALVPDFLVEEELEQGRLLRPVPDAFDSDRAYFVVLPDDKPPREGVQQLADWLVATAAGKGG
jgi:DNA-binding transcriptional LysR family regulator